MSTRIKRLLAVMMAVVTTVSCSFVALADTNEELLAQYYAALAKQQGQSTQTTDNSEALAQYYAALAKQQGNTTAKTNGKPVEVTDDTFEAEVLNYKGVVVVDFYADWCGPCQSMMPIMAKIAKEHTDYKIVEVDTDENWVPYIYGVEAIPTFLFFKDGVLKGSYTGSTSEKNMLKLIKKYAK